VHNPSNVEKHNEHALGHAAALPRLLLSWGSGDLPLRRLLFSLRIIPVDPTLVPSEAAAKGSPLWQSGGDPAGITECSWYALRTGLPAVAMALGSMCRCTRELFLRGCCPNLNQVNTF
jgi:hypothetical protein